jgi:ParB/RepB/Spo0J family partition protein
MIMTERIFQEVILSEIQVNPSNPRKNFSGPKFDELVASIRQVGVIEPILLRPLVPGKKMSLPGRAYEIVAGERRFRASRLIASENGGPAHAKIPAIVQDMTEDEAFDLMTIENLQREDLTELEEAQGFKIYLDKKGKDALPELAERTGIKPAYISRRVAVLTLPQEVIKAWEDGKIKYGHCEQLYRVKDKKLILLYLKRLQLPENNWEAIGTVKNLKEKIDGHAILLKHAKFNLDEAGCPACASNTDVQSALFEDKYEGGVYCTNTECFKKNQSAWLKANWKKFGKQAGTNGFGFGCDVKHGSFHDFQYSGSPGDKCKECSHFISRLTVEGKFDNKQVCVGDESCFNQIARASKAKKANETKASGKEKQLQDAPRVEWHGRHFREEFYKDRIPEEMDKLPITDHRCLRLSVFAIVKSNNGALIQFARQWVPKYEKKNITWPGDIDIPDIWKKIAEMTVDELYQAHRDLANVVIMQSQTVMASERHYAAQLLGIDLAAEWRLNEDYLDKKTTKEILDIIVKHGIDKDAKALAYLHENLNKKRDRFDTCKKTELVELILKSGMDLSGKVPAEILDVGRD